MNNYIRSGGFRRALEDFEGKITDKITLDIQKNFEEIGFYSIILKMLIC